MRRRGYFTGEKKKKKESEKRIAEISGSLTRTRSDGNPSETNGKNSLSNNLDGSRGARSRKVEWKSIRDARLGSYSANWLPPPSLLSGMRDKRCWRELKNEKNLINRLMIYVTGGKGVCYLSLEPCN